jgi:nucleoside-diphosphate-sugar epimerase
VNSSGAELEGRILVTGAGGFLGSRLVSRLLDRGANVVALLRPGGARPALADADRVTWLEVDLTRVVTAAQRAVLADVSTIYHLAGAGLHEAHPRSASDVARANVVGTLTVLGLVEELGGARLIHCGSGLEYGPGQRLSESSPLRPAGAYAATKAAASLLVHATAPSATIVRPFTVYGPGDSLHSLVSQTIISAVATGEIPLTGGEQTRDFVYIDDVVDGLLLAAAPSAVGSIFNLASGHETSVRALVELVVEVCGTGQPRFGALPYRAGEPSRIWGDASRARQELGWEPKVPLRTGLERTAAWLAAATDSSLQAPTTAIR